jgi:chromosome partitioning protein
MNKIAVLSSSPAAGKTTTTVGLATYLGSIGARVLVVDCDPHGDAAAALRCAVTLQHHQLEERGLPLEMILASTARTGVDSLSPVETLARSSAAEQALCDLVAPLAGRYGYVLFDCPPGTGPLPLCALTAADVALIVVPAETESLEELPAYLEEIERFRSRSNRRLRLVTLLTVHDGSSEAAAAVTALRRRYGRLSFTTVIPADDDLHQVLDGVSILNLDSPGGKAYGTLALELASRVGRLGAA